MPVTYLFDEILFDSNLFTAASAVGSPEFANSMIRHAPTGIYKTNINRYDFQNVWQLQVDNLNADDLEYFVKFWAGGFGSGYGFRIRIITDFYVEDEVIGTSDGATVAYQLTKRYSRPGADHYYTRRIIKPVVVPSPLGSSVALYEPDGTTPRVVPSPLAVALGIPAFTIKLNGTTTTDYTVNNKTGIVTLTKKTFTADAGTDVVTITAHGYANADRIKVESAGTLPAPLVAGTTYHVRDVTANTFKLAASSGGAAIDITDAGTGTHSVSGPPVGWVMSWSGEFDTPVRFMQNSFQMKPDTATSVSGLQLCEILAAELGL